MTALSRALRKLALPMVAALAGCGGEAGDPRPAGGDSTMRLPVAVLADTGPATRLGVRTPEVAVWVSRVSPSRLPDPAAIPPPPAEVPLPEGEPPPPALAVDPGLKPPILRTPGALRLPETGRAAASVELDVRVDVDGTVSDAVWAGGAADTALVRAAIQTARGMRFHPALRAGLPVAVWCRQRFDFESRVTVAPFP